MIWQKNTGHVFAQSFFCPSRFRSMINLSPAAGRFFSPDCHSVWAFRSTQAWYAKCHHRVAFSSDSGHLRDSSENCGPPKSSRLSQFGRFCRTALAALLALLYILLHSAF